MGFIRDLTGKTAVDAAGKSADVQVQAGADASAFLDPFQQIGQSGLDQAGFLTDPNAQFDFLQNNPLFQLGLDNANTQTMQGAASRGRLSSGDTLQQLNNNALLVGQGLIGDQKQSIGSLLDFGFNTAGAQGNLRTGQGAAQAAGIVGAANARGDRAGNLFGMFAPGISGGVNAALGGAGIGGIASGALSGLFSDPSLKDSIEFIRKENGFNIYSWVWNDLAGKLGLFGSSTGVMADEVKQSNPDAVTMDRGYMKVNYDMIGV
jgi:hypothetical protein